MGNYLNKNILIDATTQETETIKFYYEYGHISIDKLVQRYSLNKENLYKVISSQKWERKFIDTKDTKAVNDFYIDARRFLTVESVKHSCGMFYRYANIENTILNELEFRLEQNRLNEKATLTMNEILKIMNTVLNLKESHKLYSEAIEVPAMQDRMYESKSNTDGENKRQWTLKEIEKRMQELNLPVPSVEIEDIKKFQESKIDENDLQFSKVVK